MQMYVDDRLIALDADDAALEAALARFRALGQKRLELRRQPKQQMKVCRWQDEFFVEMETPAMLVGVQVETWEEAAQAARAYLDGQDGFIFDDDDGSDCPLCRALGIS